MKHHQTNSNNSHIPFRVPLSAHHHLRGDSRGDSRRGSALVVVCGLLGLLALIGFTFYTFANQERSNAEYYAKAAKVYRPQFDPEVLFDWALEQVIIGAQDYHPNSALSGGRHSIVPNLFGDDMAPYSGKGVNLISTKVNPTNPNSQTYPQVDQDYNGTADNPTLLEINDSPSARNGSLRSYGLNFPDPDAGYNYPDINSSFIAYRGYALDPQNRPVFVVIPSFHRPQILRNNSGYPIRDLTEPLDSAFDDINTKTKVLRPHQHHDYIDNGGNVLAKRFYRPTETPPATITSHFPFKMDDQGVWNMQPHSNGLNVEVGDWVIPPGGQNGYFYRCSQAGVTSSGPVSWSTTPGDEVIDGSAKFKVFAQPVYAFDADPDGDGVREAIWLDLDYPIQESPGGSGRFVPMFAITIYDLDALANLSTAGNTHGNLRFDDNPLGGTSGGKVLSLSTSNQGLSASEVNPFYVMNASPSATTSGGDRDPADGLSTLFQHHNNLFYRAGSEISDSTPWQDLSNMAIFKLLHGSIEFDSSNIPIDIFPGRYAEKGRLIPAYSAKNPDMLPFAGASDVDDNQNQWFGAATANKRPYTHPLDFRSKGESYYASGANLGKPIFYSPNNLNIWNQYVVKNGYTQGFHISPNGSVGIRYGIDGLAGGGDNPNPALANILIQNGEPNGLRDEADELSADPLISRAGDSADNPFAPEENFALQMSDTDLTSLNHSSRLLSLASWQLRENARAEQLRRRLTTTSFDLKQYSPEGFQSWEFSNSTSSSLSPLDSVVKQFPRAWNLTLPSPPPYPVKDPLRTEVRRLLSFRLGDRAGIPQSLRQRKLNLNYLTILNGANPSLRELSNSRTNFVQARIDRQKLAKDIYTLLYYFCGGHEGLNTFTTNNDPTTFGAIYTEAQLKDMAQFAINYVNAMDPDHALDKFKYDVNLANGWNLNDDPYNNNNEFDNDRREVFGVETQFLTLSEALAIKAAKIEDPMTMAATDHEATEYDDKQDRYFLYIELRNASPFKVPFNSQSWRISVSRNANDADTSTPVFDVGPGGRRLILKQGTVDSAGLFTISTVADDHNKDVMGNVRPSFFRVACNYDKANFDPAVDIKTIAPANVGSLNASNHLDLVTTWQPMGAVPYIIQNENQNDITQNGVGEYAKGLKLLGPGTLVVTLERRAHLDRSPPTTPAEEAQNPWIVVDQLQTTLRDFTLDPNSNAADIQGQLDNQKSRIRKQALSRGSEINSVENTTNGAAVTNDFNSLGYKNNNTRFTVWDMHRNRPLASAIELLSIPLYGPDKVTSDIDWTGKKTAAIEKFLNPIHPSNIGSPTPNKRINNRWYRLLNFVEVTDFVSNNSILNAELQHFRNAGKLNWNTLRYPEVWAGLIDDSFAFDQFNPLKPQNKQTTYLRDRAEGTARDWWVELVQTRDGSDPLTKLYLPGMAHSKPFRDFGFHGGGINSLNDNGLEETRLRQLQADLGLNQNLGLNPPSIKRRMLELRKNIALSNDPKDYHTRLRLHSKVEGNSTNRSNTYVAFIKVDFFEAHEQSNGAVRIGSKMPDSPGYRGVFVIDRTKAFQLLQTQHFHSTSTYTLKPEFDWKSLVIGRKRLQ